MKMSDRCLADYAGYGACVLAKGHSGFHQDANRYRFELPSEVSPADRLLADLYNVPIPSRKDWLSKKSTEALKAAADLCGIDAEGMSRREAIAAILENF